MAEEQFDVMFAALSHPLRRGIIEKLAAASPKTYTELLQEFKLESGTLNYHLEKMKLFLGQDAEGKYKLTEQGFAAHRLLRYLRSDIDKPHFPEAKPAPAGRMAKFTTTLSTWRAKASRSLPFQAFFRPATYIERIKNHRRAGLLVGITILAWYVLTGFQTSNPQRVAPLMYEFLVTEVLWILLVFGFLLSIYGKRPNPILFISALGIAYIPLLLLREVNAFIGVSGAPTQVTAFAAFIFLAWFLISFYFAIGGTASTTTRETAVVLILVILARVALRFLSPSLYPLEVPWLG